MAKAIATHRQKGEASFLQIKSKGSLILFRIKKIKK